MKLSARELLDDIFETVFATSCEGSPYVSEANYRKLVRETNEVLFAWSQPDTLKALELAENLIAQTGMFAGGESHQKIKLAISKAHSK
jgi:hypothetical protein